MSQLSGATLVQGFGYARPGPSWPSWPASWRRSSSRSSWSTSWSTSCRLTSSPWSRCLSPRPSRRSRRVLRRLAARRLGGVDAALQGRQQVHDLAGGLLRRRGALDLAAFDLGLHHRLDRFAVVVLELGGVEVAGQGLDEHLGHLHLGGLRLGGVGGAEVGLTDLVGPHHRLHHDHVVANAQHGQRGPVAQRDRHQRHPVRGLERLPQQRVGLGAGLLRLEVVGLLEQHRVDLVTGHELLDADLATAVRRELLHVLVGEDDHLAVLGLVALGDVGVLDFLAVQAAGPLVLDPPAVLRMDLAERDVLALRGGVQLHRDADQAEGDGTLPDCTHVIRMPRRW